MTKFAWGTSTSTGQIRQANEDFFLAVDGLFIVADGMGGHQAGEVASRLAVETVREEFDSAGTDVLVAAVEKANRELVSRSIDNPDLAGMGTTLCAMALVDIGGRDAVGVVNVGDSRLYLMSDGELRQITEDHSLVATLERQGRITAAEAATHPQRNILTRALGIDGTVMVDSWEIIPVVGDRYLLCSDGLFNEVDENRISATLRQLADPGEAARELTRLANESGGRDNITCVVVDVSDDTGRDTGRDPAGRVMSAHTGGDNPVDAPTMSSAQQGADQQIKPKARRAGQSIRSRYTWRVGAFLGALLAVVLFGLGFIVWTGTNTWYVGVEGDSVAIFRGKPGGLLWIDPELSEITALPLSDIPAASLAAVTAGVEQPSQSASRRYVANLVEQHERATSTASTTSTTLASVRPTTTTSTMPE
ncbi:PTC1 Serine/threonine protein phosphatase [Acidimicrobiia bacterium]